MGPVVVFEIDDLPGESRGASGGRIGNQLRALGHDRLPCDQGVPIYSFFYSFLGRLNNKLQYREASPAQRDQPTDRYTYAGSKICGSEELWLPRLGVA
jgi:hypothetical protein